MSQLLTHSKVNREITLFDASTARQDDLFTEPEKLVSSFGSLLRAPESEYPLVTDFEDSNQAQASSLDMLRQNRVTAFPSYVGALRARNFERMRVPEVMASPLQIWEGTVQSVDQSAGTMDVILVSKTVEIPEHTGSIELQWVSDQDKDLVRPGAVFYLTLFKRTRRGSIENSQELRFRRVPNWTRKQLQQVNTEVDALRSKFKAGRIAE